MDPITQALALDIDRVLKTNPALVEAIGMVTRAWLENDPALLTIGREKITSATKAWSDLHRTNRNRAKKREAGAPAKKRKAQTNREPVPKKRKMEQETAPAEARVLLMNRVVIEPVTTEAIIPVESPAEQSLLPIPSQEEVDALSTLDPEVPVGTYTFPHEELEAQGYAELLKMVDGDNVDLPDSQSTDEPADDAAPDQVAASAVLLEFRTAGDFINTFAAELDKEDLS